MKPLFPTYIIKMHAKRTMQGKFLKAFTISLLPFVAVLAVAVLLFLYMPGVKSSFELVLSGNFETAEERMLYYSMVMNNYMIALELLAALFAFLTVGAARLCLDMVRGKRVKIRNIFCYYNKWYIAAIYPALSIAVTEAVTAGLNALVKAGAAEEIVSLLSFALQIIIIIVTFKLMFLDYTLSENNCTNFAAAVKKSWKTVGWNTAINAVMLAFSFIGWFIMCAFTAGLALIYVIPYFNLSMAALYEANVKYNEELEIRNE